MKKLTIMLLTLVSVIALSSCSSISSSVANGSANSKTDAVLDIVQEQEGIHLDIETVIDDEKIIMDVQIAGDNMSVDTNINGEPRTIIQNETETYVLSNDIKMGYVMENSSEDALISTLNNFKNFSNISSTMIEDGTITIDENDYIYEMFKITTLLDTTVKYCYNQSDDLSYIVFSEENNDKVIKINKINLNIDEKSFEVPKDYSISKE